MNPDIHLSQSQRKAVNAPWRRTVSLILSTAGSGKTLTLTRRAIHIAIELVEGNEINSRILCVCFNRGAADEMAQRIHEIVWSRGYADRINITRRQHEPKEMVTIEIRTFHSLGFWILNSSFPSEREQVGLRRGKINVVYGKGHRDIILEALLEAGQIHPSTKRSAMNMISRSIEQEFRLYKRHILETECERFLSPPGKQPPPQKLYELQCKRAFELYTQRMSEQNSIDYDDMIVKSLSLVRTVKRVRENLSARYIALLVDEFQDLTTADFVMCKALVEKSKSLTMVGDDDQHIYSFRSLKSWFCHEMISTWFSENLEVLQLPENRRCPGAIVRSATAVIERNSRRAQKAIVAIRPNGVPVRIVGCQSLELEMRFVIRRIKWLLPRVRAAKEQILVLFRTNDLLDKFHRRFKLEEVPTSRILTTLWRVDKIGLKTSAIFALITLLSSKANKATIVWAIITVVPTLDRSFVESIFDSRGNARKEKKGDSKMNFLAGQNSTDVRRAEVYDIKLDGHAKPFPSPYLENLRIWYESHKDDEMSTEQRSKFEHLHMLLEKTEKLKLLLRNVSNVDKVVRRAEEVVCRDCGDEYDDLAEFSGSQEEEVPSSQTVDNGKAGYDLLLSAARKIDEDDEDEEENAGIKADVPRVNRTVHSEEADDDENFLLLFRRDAISRSQKRKKALARSDVHTVTALARKRKLEKKIDELCDSLEAILTKSDHSEKRKISCTERPTIILSTIHKAKGTSFAYVFLCGADDNNLPVGGRDLVESCGPVEMEMSFVEEERRLLFVSLTRTQREFVCTYSAPTSNKQLGRGLTSMSTPMSKDQQLRSFQSPFLKELLNSLNGDQNFVTESFVLETKDVETVVNLLQAEPATSNETGKVGSPRESKVVISEQTSACEDSPSNSAPREMPGAHLAAF